MDFVNCLLTLLDAETIINLQKKNHLQYAIPDTLNIKLQFFFGSDSITRKFHYPVK